MEDGKELEWSARLHGRTELQRGANGVPIVPFLEPLHTQSMEALLATLGAGELERLRLEGRAASMEKLVSEALERVRDPQR